MIRPPWGGAAFSGADDGDLRGDIEARSVFSSRLGIPGDWATLRQVHGNDTLRVDVPGEAGAADAIWTTEAGLPVTVFTADCLGVVLKSAGAVGVAHAGWRGAVAGVVRRLRDEMTRAGHPPEFAAIGPGIGSCCFEVGPEVLDRFDHRATTTWGAPSVDLVAAVTADLGGLETWTSGACTRHDVGWFSHRRDGTSFRLAASGWLT